MFVCLIVFNISYLPQYMSYRNVSVAWTDENLISWMMGLYLCPLLASERWFLAICVFNIKNTRLTYWSQLLALFVHMCTPKLLTVNSGDQPWTFAENFVKIWLHLAEILTYLIWGTLVMKNLKSLYRFVPFSGKNCVQ